MKKRDLIKSLTKLGVRFVRNGSNHDIYEFKGKTTTIPRHNEIDDFLVKKIFKQLGL